jgi:hypothetical protein
MMKKFAITTALLAASMCSQAGLISAQTDFSNVSNWTLNGNTVQQNNRLALTQTVNQGGSAFLTNAVNLQNNLSFSAFFTFEMSNPSGQTDTDGQVGADGLAFVVQTQTNSVGGTGGFLGYGGPNGIQNSLAVEFDTWDNENLMSNGNQVDSGNGNHVGINTNADMFSIAQANEATLFNIGGIWSAWIDYNGVTDLLEVRWSNNGQRSQQAGLSATVDLVNALGSNLAFFGFTSGTGSGGGLHEILSYEFRDDFEPIDVVDVNAPAMFSLASIAFCGLVLRHKRRKTVA